MENINLEYKIGIQMHSGTVSQPNPDVQDPNTRSKCKGKLNVNSLVISSQSEKDGCMCVENVLMILIF